jgi:pimeloyl-ACP methyl ester carboxylesterase
MATLAEDAVALLDALEIERANLLGWSLGSAVCQEVAIAHPDRVSGLVLWGTWATTDA